MTNDQEIEQLVTNVVQAIKAKESSESEATAGQKLTDAMKLKSMSLLEALSNLKSSSIYQVAAAAAAASSSSQSASFKASFTNYLQSTIPLANVRGAAADPRFSAHTTANSLELQGFGVG